MRGWTSLGSFLTQSLESGYGYGFSLVVLDSICDRIRLSRSTVHMLLMQFSDPEKMKYGTITTAVQSAQRDGKSSLATLEDVQAKLHELNKLASHLRPQEGSEYDDWRAVVVKRIREFLHFVVGPRIAHLKHGKPILTAATSKHVLKEMRDAIQLNYLFEVVQQERVVPLSRYGLASPLSWPVQETERARNLAMSVMAENHNLRAKVAGLLYEKGKLVESNEKLVKRLAGLRKVQLDAYRRPPSPSPSCTSDYSLFTSSSPTFSVNNSDTQPLHERPRPNTRLRSFSTTVAPIQPSSVSLDLLSPPTLRRRQSALLPCKYKDVFSGLDTEQPHSLGLSDPVTGEFASSSPPSPSDHQSTRLRGYEMENPESSRRSGIAFAAGAENLVAGYGNLGGEKNGEAVETPALIRRSSGVW
jgi:hypothetical protein